MAEDPKHDYENSENRTKAKVLDAKLDLYSEKFDPLAFLLSDKVKIPRPDAKVFDNLAMWHSHYTRGGGSSSRKTRKPEKSDLPARKWLPHQLPIQSKRPQRAPKNLLTKIQTVQGPLALLRKYMEEETRIKIVTRNEKGVRGYCIARLLTFDKHWNLVLGEVDEVWHRSIRVKPHALFLEIDNEHQRPTHSSYNTVRIPRIETTKVSKNTEKCRRHVDQMLMRGEHVVSVTRAQESEER